MFNDPFANFQNQASSVINNPGAQFAAGMAKNVVSDL
jgi:hypothetical protein